MSVFLILCLYSTTPYLLLHFQLISFPLQLASISLNVFIIPLSSDSHLSIFQCSFCSLCFCTRYSSPSLSPDAGTDVTEDKKKSDSFPALSFKVRAYPDPEQLLQIKFTLLL